MNGLRTYVNDLGERSPDELRTIQRAVSPNQEMTAYWELIDDPNKPVLWFENVEGSELPVVANLFATRSRIAGMLGTSPEQLYETWMERTKDRVEPRRVDSGPVKEMIRQGDECRPGELPIPQYFEEDAGRYITAGIVVAQDPDGDELNLSYARMQLKDRQTFGISLHSRGNLWQYHQRAEEKGMPALNVAVVIGCHPLIHLAAATRTTDEYPLAGALAEEPVDLVSCETSSLRVPGHAEIVLEGRILCGVTEEEGPFSEYTGYVTGRSTRNVFELDAMTRRDEAVYHSIIPSNSSEHVLLGGISKQATVYRRVRESIPRVKQINFPAWGTHFAAIMSIDKSGEEGIQNRAALMLMAEDYYLKYVIVVDEDIDVYDHEEVMWALSTRSQPETSVQLIERTDGNILDPSQERAGITSRLILDATRPPHWEYERPSLSMDVLNRVRETLDSDRDNE